MAKKKISRKELLKKPDEFMTLSSRAIKFFTSHQRQFKLAGVAVAIIVVVYLAAQTYFRYVNKQGQGAYNTAYSGLVENMKPDADPAALKKSEELFKDLMNDYGLSRAARLALPQVGYVKFTQKNYAEAISMYRAFLDKVSGNSEYESLARLALAACYEASGDLEKAIDTLKPILARADGPFNEVAMLNLQRIYRTSNQHDKAKGILKEFVEKHKDSPFLPMAKSRL
jgi:predicted negative regulator of RcsB-dependent stress response